MSAEQKGRTWYYFTRAGAVTEYWNRDFGWSDNIDDVSVYATPQPPEYPVTVTAKVTRHSVVSGSNPAVYDPPVAPAAKRVDELVLGVLWKENAPMPGSSQYQDLIRMVATGAPFIGFCEGCNSPRPQCQVMDCTDEAYKWLVVGPESEDAMFCETHGDFPRPAWHFDVHGNVHADFEDIDRDTDEVGILHPGAEFDCPVCDFPY